jgi:hypothetical protein
MTDDTPIKATPYQWRDPSTIPTRTESLHEKNAEIERLRAALKRIAGGWPKPMQLARETLEKKK